MSDAIVSTSAISNSSNHNVITTGAWSFSESDQFLKEFFSGILPNTNTTFWTKFISNSPSCIGFFVELTNFTPIGYSSRYSGNMTVYIGHQNDSEGAMYDGKFPYTKIAYFTGYDSGLETRDDPLGIARGSTIRIPMGYQIFVSGTRMQLDANYTIYGIS